VAAQVHANRSALIATLLTGAIAIASCGGGTTSSSASKQFRESAERRCTALLAPVSSAARFEKAHAPDDTALRQAARALKQAAAELSQLHAPRDQAASQRRVHDELRRSAAAIERYLVDRESNVSATSHDWRIIVGRLGELQRVASGAGLKSCSIPVVL
jgi:hypothetical protein